MATETKVQVTLRPETAKRVGDRVARLLFESRGNHSEIHLSENEIATLVTISIELVFKSMSVWEVK